MPTHDEFLTALRRALKGDRAKLRRMAAPVPGLRAKAALLGKPPEQPCQWFDDQLLVSVVMGKPQHVRILLQSGGCDASRQLAWGQTPLGLARLYNRRTCARLLVAAGAVS